MTDNGDKDKIHSGHFWNDLVGFLLTALLIGFFIVGLWLAVADWADMDSMPPSMTAPLPRSVALVGVFGLGGLVYGLRVGNLHVYAALEIVFAGVMAWRGLGTLAESEFESWTALITAVYLTVRGLDNWAKSKQAKATLSA